MAARLTGAPQGTVGAPGDVHLTQRNPLGLRVSGENALGGYAEYLYLKGVAATVVGSWVNAMSAAYLTVLLDIDVATTLLGRIAIATAPTVASTYGWYLVYGAGEGLALSGSAADSICWGQTTAGSISSVMDSATAAIYNAVTTAAVDETTLLQPVMLNYPFILGI